MRLLTYFVIVSCAGILERFGVAGEMVNGTYCAFVENKVITDPETGEPRIVGNQTNSAAGVDNVAIVRCQGDREYCYTLWHIDRHEKMQQTVLLQGCWDNRDHQECLIEPGCVARSPLMHRNIRNNTRFCCCRGNLCNVNVTDSVNFTAIDIIERETQTAKEYVDVNYGWRTAIISLASVSAVAVVIIIIFTGVRVYMMRRLPKEFDDGANDSAAFLGTSDSLSAGSSTSGYDLDGLKIDELISHGRYGSVYRGVLGSTDVAVKMLNATQCRCYTNERDILSLPFMRHPGIVEFRGCREDSCTQLLIVTTYEPLGSLVDYLKTRTMDWGTACHMLQSLSAGLAHLHTEVFSGDLLKPTVVHRDVNSRNILVKSDLTLCLCDFGFAMKLSAPRLTSQGGGHDERSSLADVGTLRYMAPEVLEGSVNLSDCRMSLTQVDVYAMGLVFWEIGSRCHDLYQGLPTPDFKLPFEAEIGPHPTFEEMQVAVSRHRTRPAFPDMWKNTNIAIKALRETIEECWDDDAEARISAVCAEERCREMLGMWESRFKGYISSAIYLMKDLDDKATVQRNPTCPTSYESQSDTTTVPASTTSDRWSSVSSTSGVDGTTMKPNCNVELAKSGVVAPPLSSRHAHNPVVERNTHRCSSEELTVEGNSLVPRHQQQRANPEAPQSAGHTSDPPHEVTAGHTANERPRSANRPEILQQRNIAYLQNVIDGATPKRLNTGTTSTPCEVVYDDVSRTTVTRPASMTMDDHDTLPKCGQPSIGPERDDNTAAGGSSDASAAGGDNLGYEVSTSPQSEMPNVSHIA